MDHSHRPECIAIAGTGSTVRDSIVERLITDFPGRIVPIDPSRSEICGLATVPSPAALTTSVDLLISVLPNENLLPLVEDCAPKQVRYLLPLGIGNDEEEATVWENRPAIEAAARERGIQVIDPALRSLKRGTMDGLFAPKSIALAGASNSDGKIGNLIMQRLLADYSGDLYPIHPREAQILGVDTVSTPSALPGPVDLLIALLPGERLLSMVEDCAPGSVKYLLAIPSGFGEVPGQGRRDQEAIVEAARARGMRVVGPNCMGLVNATIGLNASLVPDMPAGGQGLSLLTQSGGFGIATTLYALDHQLPIAKICDLGNTSDVQACEVMRYLEDDADTQVAGLLLENVGERAAFLSSLSSLAEKKPTVVNFLGRTEAGRRASEAHLGMTPHDGPMAEVKQSRAIFAETGRDLHNISKALCWQPLPRGNGLAVLTGTGGVGAEIADLATENGLTVPPLSDATREGLAAFVPPYAGLGNPVDLTPIWRQYPDVYPAVLRLIIADENIDQVIVTITDVATGVDPLAPAMTALMQDPDIRNASKPIYVFWGSRDDMLANMKILESARLPCYRTTLEVVRTVAAITNYAGRQETD